MMTLEQIVARLQDRRPSMVAEAIGCRVGTIIDIREGRVTNPAYETIRKLSDYFSRDALA